MKNVILFDLDDTLIDTHAVFRKYIDALKIFLAKETQREFDEITKVFITIHNEKFDEFHVDFDRLWPSISKKLTEELGLNDHLSVEIQSYLDSILHEVPKLKDGVVETLEELRIREYSLGLVTHALKDWTDFKLDSLALRNYFTHIEIADASGVKSSSCWLHALSQFNIKPEDGIVVGDNINGDIIAAHSIGVRRLFWVDQKNGWSVYRTGELPESTITLREISELIDYLE